MRRPLLARLAVLVLAFAACSGSAAPSQPPRAADPKPADADADAGGGFASIPEATAPRTQHSSEVTPELADRIRSTFGERCRFERACGEHIGVDCDAAVDGPYYYVRRESLEVVSRCGGHCMSGTCTDCPPRGWTCATY